MKSDDKKEFSTKEEQLKDIAEQVNKVEILADAKDSDLVPFSDVEAKPCETLKKLKLNGVITKVEVKNGKLDLTLNPKFFGTIVFAGDLTSYKGMFVKKKVWYEAPFGNDIMVEVFENLLEKVKKHNKDNQKQQIQFIAVPGNHEFLGFQGMCDDSKMIEMAQQNVLPIAKLKGAKVIAEIQKYYLEQVKVNHQEDCICDDDYGDGKTNIRDKIKNLQEYIKKIDNVIYCDEGRKKSNCKVLENVCFSLLRSITDVSIQYGPFDVLDWSKSALLSKIVFEHKGKKYRTLHSFSLFVSKNVFNEQGGIWGAWEEGDITSATQKSLLKEQLNNNTVNVGGVKMKNFIKKDKFCDNKIATFVGHEGEVEIEEQSNKVFCVDFGYNKNIVCRVNNDGLLQCYDMNTGKKIDNMFMKMMTADISKQKMADQQEQINETSIIKLQSKFRQHLARKEFKKKRKGDSLIKKFFLKEQGQEQFYNKDFQEQFNQHFGTHNWFNFLKKNNTKKPTVGIKPKKIKNVCNVIQKKKNDNFYIKN